MKGICIILAAGYSRRLGLNKSFLKYKNTYFIDLIIQKTLELNMDIKIVANENNYEYLKTNYKDFNVVLNAFNKGQNTSIKIALNNVLDYDYAIFLPIDQIFLKTNSIKTIISKYKENYIVVPRFNNINSLPTIFDKKYFKELCELDNDSGGRVLIQKYKDKVIFVDLYDELEGKDIDTKEDLRLIDERICNY
ncbi:NTP transferase domain-containing protein [Campylobacter sp. 2018MI10]|uniref:NTP transferase domain-containing protein n=3 Tax=Campylobacter TaxID=194 RepID=UPI001BDABD3D|nr:NTP transferase domain-containing protein [Campylobacter sp. 2018MI10]MBT0885558.1 NTP transferase domain-containing protein [Campylobacter sp. 2018MI10]